MNIKINNAIGYTKTLNSNHQTFGSEPSSAQQEKKLGEGGAEAILVGSLIALLIPPFVDGSTKTVEEGVFDFKKIKDGFKSLNKHAMWGIPLAIASVSGLFYLTNPLVKSDNHSKEETNKEIRGAVFGGALTLPLIKLKQICTKGQHRAMTGKQAGFAVVIGGIAGWALTYVNNLFQKARLTKQQS